MRDGPGMRTDSKSIETLNKTAAWFRFNANKKQIERKSMENAIKRKSLQIFIEYKTRNLCYQLTSSSLLIRNTLL